MAQIRKYLSALLIAPVLSSGVVGLCRPLWADRFYYDDPIWQEPAPLHISAASVRETGGMLEAIRSVLPKFVGYAADQPAGAVNTLGEVPDNSWFQNRHGRHSLSVAELRRGAGDTNPPASGEWQVLAAERNFGAVRLVIEDREGKRFLLKLDRKEYPEMSTAAEIIGSKFFYALGYNVPEVYIVSFPESRLKLASKATLESSSSERQPLLAADLKSILDTAWMNPDGKFRASATLYIPGQHLGPFLYHGVRPDDPNDIVPHEDRRDLRGLYIFAAWLNYTSLKFRNTLDTLSGGYIRHYLIDFDSILGSAETAAKEPRAGHLYFADYGAAAVQLLTLGVYMPRWMRTGTSPTRGVGRFTAEEFDPRKWKPSYPNPAFQKRGAEDEFWAAKQVMRFTAADIRTLVETGQFTDARAVDELTEILVRRRDRIGGLFLGGLLPLDDFRLSRNILEFDDLAVKFGLSGRTSYNYTWFRFDNRTGRRSPVPVGTDERLPPELAADMEQTYFGVTIQSSESTPQPHQATVFFRRDGASITTVGVDRS